ncbi:MBL fold metallo-hydrolase [Sporohalobacter salinus]|uniref:MBL fold metallo-hydrolase n=1 Tax=Sporohalobacter salinus TaxID=1494606 RepID=UPI0019600401|nr:glyoxylase-like metal-dependent hydrolase (beta-lactamase superfamily II) [Sporohalobacter salinus]
MDIKQIKDNIYYLDNASNIGMIKTGKEAILIDSGLDDSTAKKALNILKQEGISPTVLINTHAHADHCGGNAYLKEKLDIEIYTSRLEADLIEKPYLEPFFLFSGASPIEDLKNKFLMAKDSQVDYIIDNDTDHLIINGVELDIFALPGHTAGQIGIGAAGVLFCGDAIFTKKALEKHKMLFHTDILQQKETLSLLKESNYDFYLPTHGGVVEDIESLIELNLNSIKEIEEYLLELLTEQKLTTEEVLKKLCQHFDNELTEVSQYYLTQTIAKAYLSSLYQQQKIDLVIKSNLLYWYKD